MSRNEIIIEHEGERLNVSQWSRRLGISNATLTYRLRAGWPLEAALSPERRHKRPSHDDGLERIKGEFDTLVRNIDHDLRRFRDCIDRPRNHDRGVGRMKRAERQDQNPPVAQDRG